MNITELRYLVAIMKNGSVSAAAKELYVAQPNVSKALKNLEEEYGLRIFERTSTGMLPTEQGRQFITQAARILEEIDKLEQHTQQPQGTSAELRVAIPRTSYASDAAVDFIERMANAARLRVHVQECSAVEALNYVLRRGYHMALLRYPAENEEDFSQYCAQHTLHMEPVMEFEHHLLTNRDGPLAQREIHNLDVLGDFIEVLHEDAQLPDGRISSAYVPCLSSRRVHVYGRCSQFAMLNRLPLAYMWASPMPQHVLDQYHLALCRCPALHQQMRDVLVYPEKGLDRPEELTFRELLLKEAQETVK